MEVTILVPSFGQYAWAEMAIKTAEKAAKLFGVPVVHRHARTLAEARNACLDAAKTEWVIHLDADDELDIDYVDAMDMAFGDIRVPRVAYVRNGTYSHARFPQVAGHTHQCVAGCLEQGNWIVVGAAVRRQMVLDVGGWREFDWSEDWDLWLRCHLAGAEIEPARNAIYVAHVRPDSRNRAPSSAFKNEVHHQIARANMPWLYEGEKP